MNGEKDEEERRKERQGGDEIEKIRVMERDREIIREIDRWRVIQGKHIKELVGFEGQRACDRRLRKLIDMGYITREKILYGVAGIYRNTNKAQKIMPEKITSVNKKIRIEQIMHDIAVVESAIYFNKKHEIKYSEITTEIELHSKDGFGVRKHRPDYIFEKDGKTTCVEIELNLKAKNRFENNIKNNFENYDKQIWIVTSLENKIAKILKEHKESYPDIEILELNQIQESIK